MEEHKKPQNIRESNAVSVNLYLFVDYLTMLSVAQLHISSNDTVFNEWWIRKDMEESGSCLFKADLLSRRFHGMTEKNHETSN
jgi:hypothetical protein